MPRIAVSASLAAACFAIGLLGGAPARAADDLTVSAAASLTNAFKELAPLFEAQNPGTKVQLNFGSSGALLQQIAKGAPVDVFASADQETMDQAQQQSLIKPAERRNFVSNTLVVVVPESSKNTPKAVADLTQGTYHASPSVCRRACRSAATPRACSRRRGYGARSSRR